MCVPITKLPDLIAQTKLDVQATGSLGSHRFTTGSSNYETINLNCCLCFEAPILGHVGDGNFHALIVFNLEDPVEYKNAENLANRITKYGEIISYLSTND